MTLRGNKLEVLTSQNPPLDKSQQPDGAVTTNASYEFLEAQNIEIWADFTYDNIVAAFGEVLVGDQVEADVIKDRQGSPFEIITEASVDRVLNTWNVQVCRRPMKKGATQVQKALGLPLADITMRVAERGVVVAESERGKKPDFAIFLKDSHSTHLVWGEAKLSSKWKSDPDDIEDNLIVQNWIWPWRQIATYCVGTNTRYGCLVTPEELVVVRLYRKISSNKAKYNVQYNSIPWDNEGKGKLTVNLGLWAMAMMALNTGHRPIFQRADTLPINTWWKDRSRDGSTIYEHHLTGIKEKHLPKGAKAMERPDTIPGVQEFVESTQRPKRSRRVR